MNEITNVEIFFKSHQVHVSRIWLESCITWCKQENLPPNYTLKELEVQVFHQWLLLDLRDLEIACLPPNLSTKQKIILDNNFTLQLMKIVDISKPKYWQLQRIRYGIPKNLEQEFESSKRVLQLTLTDGVQEVEAMEYKQIKCLNMNLSPGVKIRLIGPIQVRRGRLILEEKHVKVIGGEVDTLTVSNASENVLAQFLKQPLNPMPNTIQESMLDVERNDIDTTGSSSMALGINQSNTQQNLQRNNLITQNQRNINVNVQNSNPTTFQSNNGSDAANNNRPLHNTKQPVGFTNEFEDEFNIDQEMEILLEMEHEFEQAKAPDKSRIQGPSSIPAKNFNTNQNIKTNNPIAPNQKNVAGNIPKSQSTQQTDKSNISNLTKNTKPPVEDLGEFDDDFSIDQELETLTELENEIKQTGAPVRNKSKTPDLFEDLDIDFEKVNIPAAQTASNTDQQIIEKYFDKPKQSSVTQEHQEINTKSNTSIHNLSDSFEVETNSQNSKNVLFSPPPVIWSVDKLVKTIPNVSNGKFKIKAKFKSVIEKMSVKENEFNLVVEVGDNSNNISLKIHNDVVAEVLGVTATAFNGLKDELAKNNVDVERKVLETLRTLQVWLTYLDNIMEVTVNIKEKFPILTKIL